MLVLCVRCLPKFTDVRWQEDLQLRPKYPEAVHDTGYHLGCCALGSQLPVHAAGVLTLAPKPAN